MVIKIIAGRLKELNCQINKMTMPSKHGGKKRLKFSLLSMAFSISPPTFQRWPYFKSRFSIKGLIFSNSSGALSSSCFSSMVRVRIWLRRDIRLNSHIEISLLLKRKPFQSGRYGVFPIKAFDLEKRAGPAIKHQNKTVTIGKVGISRKIVLGF